MLIREKVQSDPSTVSTPLSLDDIFDQALEAGAEDIVEEESPATSTVATDEIATTERSESEQLPGFDIYIEATNTAKFAQQMEQHGYKIEEIRVEYVANPDTTVQVQEKAATDLKKLISALENVEDVTGVYTNAE